MNSLIKKLLFVSIFYGLILILHSCKEKTAPPIVTTDSITDITFSSAVSGGEVTSDEGAEVTLRGVCWSKHSDPTTSDSKTENGSGTGTFTSDMTDLMSSTIYYVRAYAINSAGTGYGNQQSFQSMTEYASDVDGNAYAAVNIGTQVWLKENLKTTKYNDGTSIPLVTGNDEWNNLTTGAYCLYNNSVSYKSVYGALYNWFTVNTSKLCPAGWHVPTLEESSTLVTFAGGESIAGRKLKESGTAHWIDANSQGSDSYGFCLLPAGLRDNGVYDLIGYDGGWWTASETSSNNAWLFDVWVLSHPAISQYSYSKKFGYSVRCIKD
jgi:uncharacterized protein (TIGR02145 family)